MIFNPQVPLQRRNIVLVVVLLDGRVHFVARPHKCRCGVSVWTRTTTTDNTQFHQRNKRAGGVDVYIIIFFY